MLTSLFTTLAVKAEAFSRHGSWRLGRSMERGIAITHEAWLGTHRWIGGGMASESQTRAAQSKIPKTVPRFPSPYPYTEGVSKRADELKRGICRLENDRRIGLEDLSWVNDPYGGRVCIPRFLFHCLYWVEQLIGAFHSSDDLAYLARAKELTRRWIAECLYTERWPHIWDDHITALRAIVLCRVWIECRTKEPQASEFMMNLFGAIMRHGEKLAHKAFYRAEHDHGVTQSYALLAISLLCPEDSKSRDWLELARSRLEAQIVANVTAEGLHREHSPFYHFFVFRQFCCAYEIARAHGLRFSDAFDERLRLMLGSGVYLLKPDGTLAALGDTAKSDPVLVEEQELSAWSKESVGEFLWSKTQGAEGRAPQPASRLFPGAGYAVMRSGWGENEPFTDERYFIIRLANFNAAHRHQDLFSFEIYGYGEDLIVDSGGPFSYGSRLRNYFLSAAAHNTVTVDGLEQQAAEARVLHWQTEDDFDLLDVQCQSFPGISHRRAVIFMRPDYYIILDRLKSTDVRRYRQLFHLNPKLQASEENLEIRTVHNFTGPTVRIIPLIKDDLHVTLHRGSSGPRQGWICCGDEQMEPNLVLEYSRQGNKAGFAVLIIPERPGQITEASGAIGGRLFEEQVSLDVVINGTHDRIIIAPDGRGRASRGS